MLKSTEENTAEVDVSKGETLQEISEIVKKMTNTLNDSKDKLQPMVRYAALWGVVYVLL